MPDKRSINQIFILICDFPIEPGASGCGQQPRQAGVMADNEKVKELGKADRDIVALGIATASIILFAATGGQVVPDAVMALMGRGVGPDKLLANAMLRNSVPMV